VHNFAQNILSISVDISASEPEVTRSPWVSARLFLGVVPFGLEIFGRPCANPHGYCSNATSVLFPLLINR